MTMQNNILDREYLSKAILEQPDNLMREVIGLLDSDSYLIYLRDQESYFKDFINDLKDPDILSNLIRDRPDAAYQTISKCLDHFFTWSMLGLYHADNTVDMSKLEYDPTTNRYLYRV